jgi:hypothetical protein
MHQSLRTLGGVMNGDLVALRHLNERAVSHDRHHMDIKPEFYDLWKIALMKTASIYDREWSAEVSDSWDLILNEGIRYMTKRY